MYVKLQNLRRRLELAMRTHEQLNAAALFIDAHNVAVEIQTLRNQIKQLESKS